MNIAAKKYQKEYEELSQFIPLLVIAGINFPLFSSALGLSYLYSKKKLLEDENKEKSGNLSYDKIKRWSIYGLLAMSFLSSLRMINAINYQEQEQQEINLANANVDDKLKKIDSNSIDDKEFKVKE